MIQDYVYHVTYRYRAIQEHGLCVPPLGMSLDGRNFWLRQVFEQYQGEIPDFYPDSHTGFVGQVSLLFVTTDLREARGIKTDLMDGATLFEGYAIFDTVQDWNPSKDVKILKVDTSDLPVLFRFPDRAYEQYDEEYSNRFDSYGFSTDEDSEEDDSDWDFKFHVLVLPVECPQAPSSVFKVVK